MRELPLREPEPRDLLVRPVEPDRAGLARVAEDRLALAAGLARDVAALAAPERTPADLVERLVLLLLPDLAPPALLDRVAVERPLLADRAPLPLDRVPELDEPLPDRRDPPLSSPPAQLPLITRWAASATASAISDPSRVALDIAVDAAFEAASAASSPASRILRRAAGLALIAAAAAARPAASISRLIAAFASLSTVVSFEPEEELELLPFFDFAIARLPVSLERQSRAVTVPKATVERTLPRGESCGPFGMTQNC